MNKKCSSCYAPCSSIGLCDLCAMLRECTRCYRRLDDRYFEDEDIDICVTCAKELNEAHVEVNDEHQTPHVEKTIKKMNKKCSNCRIPCANVGLCDLCTKLRECTRCHRRLHDRCFEDLGVDACITCAKRPKKSTAVEGVLAEQEFPTSEHDTDVQEFVETRRGLLREVLQQAIDEHRAVKAFVRTDVRFGRETEDGHRQEVDASFGTEPVVIYDVNDLDADAVVAEINRKIEDFNRRGSNWQVDRLLNFTLGIVPYRPLQGSSFLETPPEITGKQAVLNIENYNDELCFVWSILAALHPVNFKNNANRVSKYKPYFNELNLEGLTFPLPVSQIPRFEAQNPDISVNVLSMEQVFPYSLDLPDYPHQSFIQSAAANIAIAHTASPFFFSKETNNTTLSSDPCPVWSPVGPNTTVKLGCASSASTPSHSKTLSLVTYASAKSTKHSQSKCRKTRTCNSNTIKTAFPSHSSSIMTSKRSWCHPTNPTSTRHTNPVDSPYTERAFGRNTTNHPSYIAATT